VFANPPPPSIFSVQGEGRIGNLGYGNTVDKITASSADINFGTKTPAAIAAGSFHNLALMTDGTLMSWGNRPDDGYETSPRDTVTFNEPVDAITAGFRTSCAKLRSGCIKCWCVASAPR
jgi:alpha-tubulin suppressor-like RCC1 family protein